MNSEITRDNRPRYLHEKEVARLLGLSISTLQKWRWRGEGPAYAKLGRAVRYREDQLREWLESQTIDHTGRPARDL